MARAARFRWGMVEQPYRAIYTSGQGFDMGTVEAQPCGAAESLQLFGNPCACIRQTRFKLPGIAGPARFTLAFR